MHHQRRPRYSPRHSDSCERRRNKRGREMTLASNPMSRFLDAYQNDHAFYCNPLNNLISFHFIVSFHFVFGYRRRRWAPCDPLKKRYFLAALLHRNEEDQKIDSFDRMYETDGGYLYLPMVSVLIIEAQYEVKRKKEIGVLEGTHSVSRSSKPVYCIGQDRQTKQTSDIYIVTHSRISFFLFISQLLGRVSRRGKSRLFRYSRGHIHQEMAPLHVPSRKPYLSSCPRPRPRFRKTRLRIKLIIFYRR